MESHEYRIEPGGPNGDDLIVLSVEQTNALQTLDGILGSSKTFGEYLENLRAAGTGLERYTFDLAEFLEDHHLSEDDRFDYELLPGVGDGDFPPDPRALMIDTLPDDLLEELVGTCDAEVVDHRGRAPHLRIPATATLAARSTVTRLGYSVVESDQPTQGPPTSG